MNYRSLNDLSYLITRHAARIDHDIDLVVGIPRSGMLAASIVALKLNLPLTDLPAFLRNDELKRGSTRLSKRADLRQPQAARKILLVDDSIASGRSLDAAQAQLREVFGGQVVTLAVFAEKHNAHRVDVHFERVEQPRVFEWNILHHSFIGQACLDIDGVLCEDPTAEQNDDGPRYLEFLENARPLFVPSVKIGHLVTSRLEKYRPQTEAWLARHGVKYDKLHMLDLPSAEERRRLNIHHKFKAAVYAQERHARLFIESEEHQALAIMLATDKPVYCIESNQMYQPGPLATARVTALRKSLTLHARGKALAKKALARLATARPARSGRAARASQP